MLYDLGELVYFTDALLAGSVPGRDFAHNAYGPGRYLLLAGLWTIFGRSFDVIWGLFFVLRLGITAVSWELSRRLIRGAWSWLPPLLLIVFPGPLHKGFYLLGTLLLALGLLHVTSRNAWHQPQPWLSLGWGAAALSFFRVDLGGFALLLGLVLLVVTGAPGRRLVPLFAPMAVGASLLAGVLLYLGGSEALIASAGQVLDDVWKNQTIAYPTMPGGAELLAATSPIPYLLWSPLPIYAALALVLWRRRSRESEWSPPLLATLIVLLLGLLTCNQIRMKPEYGHFLQSTPMLWLALAVLAQQAWSRGLGLRLAATFAVLAVFVALMIATVSFSRGNIYTGAFTIPQDRDRQLSTPLGAVDLSPGEYAELAPLLETMAAFPPGPVWVPSNQPLYPALLDRPEVTGHSSLVYYADNLERQVEIIAKLEEERPRLAVFVDDSIEGPERRLEQAAPQIYRYLHANYEPMVTYGRNRLMRLRGEAGPRPK